MKRLPGYMFVTLATFAAPMGAASSHDVSGSQRLHSLAQTAVWQAQSEALNALPKASVGGGSTNDAYDSAPGRGRGRGADEAGASAASEVVGRSGSAPRPENPHSAATAGDLAATVELLTAYKLELISLLQAQLEDTTAHYRRTCGSHEEGETGREIETLDARCLEALQAIELLQQEVERLQQEVEAAKGRVTDESENSEEAAAGTVSKPRAIPVVPTDPESRAGRILYGIADRLEQWIGPESKRVRLLLDAPMRAQEQDEVVTVNLPGAKLLPVFPDHDSLSDVSVEVTEQAKDTYAFRTRLGRATSAKEVFRIDETAISGRWRADLGIPTRVKAVLSGIRVNEPGDDDSAKNVGALERLTVREEWTEVLGQSWRLESKIDLSGLSFQGSGLERLEATTRMELSDVTPLIKLHRDLLESGQIVPQTAEESMAAILSSRFDAAFDLRRLAVDGREYGNEMTALTLGELALQIDFDGRNAPQGPDVAAAVLVSRFDTSLDLRGLSVSGWGRDGVVFRLGSLLCRVELDGQSDLAAVSTRIEISLPWLHPEEGHEMLHAFMPDVISADVELERLPLREIVELSQSRAGQIPVIFGEAGAAAEIRDFRVARASEYELRADGRFRVDPQSRLGVTGTARIHARGLDSVIAWSAAKGNTGLLAYLLAVKGLGRPIVDTPPDAQVLTYDAVVAPNGDITLNGIPLDQL